MFLILLLFVTYLVVLDKRLVLSDGVRVLGFVEISLVFLLVTVVVVIDETVSSVDIGVTTGISWKQIKKI